MLIVLQTSQGREIFRTTTKKVIEGFSSKTTQATTIYFHFIKKKELLFKLESIEHFVHLATYSEFNSRQCLCSWFWTFHVWFYWGSKWSESWSSRHAWWDQISFEREILFVLINFVCKYFIKWRYWFSSLLLFKTIMKYEHSCHVCNLSINIINQY